MSAFYLPLARRVGVEACTRHALSLKRTSIGGMTFLTHHRHLQPAGLPENRH